MTTYLFERHLGHEMFCFNTLSFKTLPTPLLLHSYLFSCHEHCSDKFFCLEFWVLFGYVCIWIICRKSQSFASKTVSQENVLWSVVREMVILEHFFPVYFWLFVSLKTVMTFPVIFFWLSWWLKKNSDYLCHWNPSWLFTVIFFWLSLSEIKNFNKSINFTISITFKLSQK